ncbi:MAG: hypothetical protein Q4F56_00745 [Candidatus Saccharibacteria bacterium]|nr:hypothetical protein [Candidatus Saccharibacteria bacterium]
MKTQVKKLAQLNNPVFSPQLFVAKRPYKERRSSFMTIRFANGTATIIEDGPTTTGKYNLPNSHGEETHRFQLDLALCPTEYKQAHYYSGAEPGKSKAGWKEECTGYNRSCDDCAIELHLMAYGDCPNTLAELKHYHSMGWDVNLWLDDFWEERPGSWLVPASTKSHSARVYPNKSAATEAVLCLADKICTQTGEKYADVEAIRIEKNAGRRQIRLYTFKFCCEEGGQPYIDSEICGA